MKATVALVVVGSVLGGASTFASYLAAKKASEKEYSWRSIAIPSAIGATGVGAAYLALAKLGKEKT